jgi:nitrile hydratase accessory protein
MTGSTAPPRANGELVFEEPWHARVFGLAVGLVEEQGLEWEEFRSRLIDEIGAWGRGSFTPSGETYNYYERWAAALERLVLETGLVSIDDLEAEIREIEDGDAHDRWHGHKTGNK